jgi:hypothetical protein
MIPWGTPEWMWKQLEVPPFYKTVISDLMKMRSAVFPSLCADRPTNRHEDDVHIFRFNHFECNTQQCLGIKHELSWS